MIYYLMESQLVTVGKYAMSTKNTMLQNLITLLSSNKELALLGQQSCETFLDPGVPVNDWDSYNTLKVWIRYTYEHDWEPDYYTLVGFPLKGGDDVITEVHEGCEEQMLFAKNQFGEEAAKAVNASFKALRGQIKDHGPVVFYPIISELGGLEAVQKNKRKIISMAKAMLEGANFSLGARALAAQGIDPVWGSKMNKAFARVR